MDTENIIVIDNGTDRIKAGCAAEDIPTAVFPTAVGRAKTGGASAMSAAGGSKDAYVGDEAVAKRHMLAMKYPIESRIITSWDDMEKVWRHTLYDALDCEPDMNAFMLTEPPLNAKSKREKMTEIMFEKFEIPLFFVSLQPMLALFASGRTSGVVVDVGAGNTTVSAVSDGELIEHGVESFPVGGRDLTKALHRELGDRITDRTDEGLVTARDIKERYGLCALDFDKDTKAAVEVKYELPDGSILTLGRERYHCAEALFKPSYIGSSSSGMHTHVYNALMRYKPDVRKEMSQNIVLTGGSTLLSGIDARFVEEMKQFSDREGLEEPAKVIASPGRKYSVWLGGAMLAAVSTFGERWINQGEYFEEGAGVVHRKCPI